MKSKIRLGILGAGRIVARVMEDMNRAENIELTAIAARNLARAQEEISSQKACEILKKEPICDTLIELY